MDAPRYGQREVIEWLFRYGPPVLAWVLVFAFFAWSGAAPDDASKPAARPPPATQPVVDDGVAETVLTHEAPNAANPEVPDAALVAHEALDPVGAGRGK